jgi:hypothetical protein
MLIGVELMKKLSQYGVITLAAIALLTAGGLRTHADATVDKSHNPTAQVTANNKPVVGVSNQHSQATPATTQKNQPVVKVNNSFTAVAMHKGFEYNNAALAGRQRQSFDQGTAFQVFKVFKINGRLVYVVQNQFGRSGYVAATQVVPIPDKANLLAYKMLLGRAEVPANFVVTATKNGVEYGLPDLSSNSYSGYFLTNQKLQVLGVTKVNNNLRYLVIGQRSLAYISAAKTKPVNMKANMKNYHVALKALQQPVKTPKKHKPASHKAKAQVKKGTPKKATKKPVAKKKAPAKSHMKRHQTSYYTNIKAGQHRAIVQKTVVAHVKASFKDHSARNKHNVMMKKQVISFNRIVKVGRTYRLHLTNGHYVTANKAFVKIIK